MKTETTRHVWAAGALLLVASVTAANLVHLAQRVPPPPRATGVLPNRISDQERRLAGVRAKLQAHAAPRTLGYVADLPPEQMRGDDASMEEYFASQFVVVPWVLEANYEGQTWLLANLRRATLAQRMPAGCKVVEDLGNGVWLLQKTVP